jgi:tetratricopeptide (TPR) repeat protein
MLARTIASISLVTFLAGCATTASNGVSSLPEAQKVAWSLDANQDEMLVSVSPARQSLQIAGTTGLVVGSGISAVVNDKYRRIVREALTGYEPGALFEERLAARLNEAMGPELERVPPLGSTAGYSNKREAQEARLEGIGKNSGADALLNLDMTYGIFGYEGILVAKLDGRLLSVPNGRAFWEDTIVASTQPVFAGDGLSDPTKQFGPDLGNLRLTVAEGAVEQWTANQGAELKHRYEDAVEGAVSALLASLDLVHEPLGEYVLGVNAMNRKKFAQAEEHFTAALTLDPHYLPALNARAVNLYHNDQVDAAIQLAQRVADSHPEHPLALYNLAWFHAVGKNDGAAAKPYYDKARALGMPENSKIDKAITQG